MMLSKKYSKDIPDILSPQTLTDANNLTMVVDMGHAFIKTSLFATFEGERNYLIHAELRETDKIISNGEINFNLLSRYVTRKATELNDFGKIHKLIVIPPRIYTNTLAMHKLEFIEKYSEYKKQLITSYRDIFNDVSNIDWSVITNNPQNDYRNLVVDSLTDENAIKFGNAFVNVPVDSVIVTSPSTAYLGLNQEEPYLVLEIGHITTSIAIIDKGLSYLRNVSIGGQFITDSLVDKDVTIEDMKYKHSLSIEELPVTVDAFFEDIIKEIGEAVDTYKTISDKELKSYCVLGGTGNMRLEETINDLRTELKRFYPQINVENVKNLPTETINYFLPSISTFNYMSYNWEDKERRIDFTASKGNVFQYRVKKIADWFRKNKVMTLAITVSCYAIFALLLYSADRSNKYFEEVQANHAQLQNENSTVTTQLGNAQTEYATLMSSEINGFEYDTGKLLDKVKRITPPNINIRQFNINSAEDTGVIVVASQNQVVTATLLTLLQKGNDAPFTKADIVEIKKETESLEEMYITTIYVEGRNL